MNTVEVVNEKLAAIFPREADIPAEYAYGEPVHQKEYLVNGEIKIWNGPVQDIFSPVCIQTPEGPKQKLLGSTPLLTEKEATDALNAAVEAYKNGTGLWPTMTVEDRIRAMEKFVIAMKSKRAEVVKT